jgi:Tfp pilus tip-associated adhesin PilY1
LGERLVTDPTSFEGQVIYTTLLPNSVTDPCATDGKTTTLQLNPLTGGALSYRTIDTSGDQQITSIDAMVSGRQTKATYGTTIIKKGGGNLQIIQADARTGENQLTQSKGVTGIPSMRLWRQILNVQ